MALTTASPNNAAAAQQLANDALLPVFERLRTRLLDLTLRNRLLNFRHTNRATLRAVDELPDALWTRLRDGDELVFVPVPEPPRDPEERRRGPSAEEHARSLGIATSYELPVPADEPKRSHSDKHIQTLLYPSDLETTLRTIATAARSAIEETGTNMLYLVFGFLAWYDSDAAQQPYLAPLLVLPASLRRGDPDPRTKTFRYYVSYSGEDVSINVSLHEKLQRDFGLRLPALDDDELPEAYFARVRQAIESVPRWQVHRQVSLATLSFGKLLMYRDLDPSCWPQSQPLLEQHLLRELFGAEEKKATPGEEYRLDTPQMAPLVPPLVLDADSSQHSAVLDVCRGDNLVIEGPPGTGKSQTIANIIAAAMVQGKSVLFVAEKLAALEVVRRRLDDVGLGAFCLELHSHKTRKQELLADINRRLELRGSFAEPRELDEHWRVALGARDQLNDHARHLHAPFGRLGWSSYEILWGLQRRQQALGVTALELKGLTLPNPERWGVADLEQGRALVAAMAEAQHDVLSVAGCVQAHPWAGVRKVLETDQRAAVVPALERVRALAHAGREALAQVHTLTAVELSDELSHLNWVASVPRVVAATRIPMAALLPELADASACSELEAFCGVCARWQEDEKRLRRWVAEPGRASLETLPQQKAAWLQALPLVPQGTTLGACAALIESWKQAQVWLDWGEGLRQHVSSLLGMPLPPTVAGALAAAQAVVTAMQAPAAVLPYRIQLGLDDASQAAFDRMWHQAQALLAERQSLSAHFELGLVPAAPILSAHLAACASAGALRFLDSKFKAAQQCYATINKSASPDSPAAMAQGFQQLVAYSARVDEFVRSAGQVAGLGPWFRGLDTPFAPMAQARSWQRATIGSLAWTANVAPNLAPALAWARPEQLQALAALVPDAAAARQALDGATRTAAGLHAAFHGPTPFPALSIEQARQALTSAMGVVGAAMVAASQLGLAAGMDARALTTTLDALEELLQRKRKLQPPARLQTLTAHFTGPDMPLQPLREALDASAQIRAAGLPQALLAWLWAGNPSQRATTLAEQCAPLAAIVQELTRAFEAFASMTALDEPVWWREDKASLANRSLTGVQSRAAEALQAQADLGGWCELARARSACEQAGLTQLVAAVEAHKLDVPGAVSAFELVVYQSLAHAVMAQDPALAGFDRAAHDQLRERFARLDRKTLELYRQRAASLIDTRPVPAGVGHGPVAQHTELALLKRECRKQKRHIPIRQLVRRAGGALQALKPCFMMGPRAVAQYLEPGELSFDLLVMDEASQLRPEDAIGALCRAKQAVIVGDSNQLPPTSFFDRSFEPDEEDAEATEADEAESILDVARAGFGNVRRLRWHYRSRHESLIAFSNLEFYDGKLIVFPSPCPQDQALGVKFVHVPEARYFKGQNPTEASAVVQAIARHLLEHPEESLGVATMNFKQADLIEAELDLLLKDDEQLRQRYVAAVGGSEPFFIKNLENVQGDERDVIFISVTYGKDERGVLHQRFGPINGAMGWRRLNVLFTRAKRRVVVFCSFDPSELRTDETSARGSHVLGSYLKYAQQGLLPNLPQAAAQALRTDFENAVAAALVQRGLQVHPRVGVAGCFVDLAITDPLDPGRFALGIECDGPGYRDSYSARDRDRLRQSALESLGWRMHRIWTLAWHRDPAFEAERVIRAAQGATQAAPTVQPRAEAAAPVTVTQPAP